MTKLLFMSPHSSIPPRYGGQLRVHHLRRVASSRFQVFGFTQVAQRADLGISFSPITKVVNTNYVEFSTRNPMNLLLFGLSSLRWNSPPFWQSRLLHWFPPIWLKRKLEEVDLIHIESPYQFGWVFQKVARQKPIILGAPNVETELYSSDRIFASSFLARAIMHSIEVQEAFAMAHCDKVITTSALDADKIRRRYQVSPERIVIVPNGVDCDKFAPAQINERRERKADLGLADKSVVLFSGSIHRPNIEAVTQILNWAEAMMDSQIHFLVVGSVGKKFTHVGLPNVTITGFVDEIKPFLQASDIAINPMLSGSGTNLKQLEYMAMGLPCLTTEIGARGLPIESEKQAYIVDLDLFPEKLMALLADSEERYRLGHIARQLVVERFDWNAIGEKLIKAYEDLLAEQHRI